MNRIFCRFVYPGNVCSDTVLRYLGEIVTHTREASLPALRSALLWSLGKLRPIGSGGLAQCGTVDVPMFSCIPCNRRYGVIVLLQTVH